MNDLHLKALSLAETYIKTEAGLLEVLSQIDKEKKYFKYGYKSLYEYCIKALKLPEGTSYNFVTVVRKSNTVPELKEAVIDGSLSVSKAKKISSVITLENQSLWIEKAKELPRLELEKEVAAASPKEAVQERAKYVSQDRLELKCGLSEKIMNQIKRVQELESKRQKKNNSIEEALDLMSLEYLERHDPIEKAKRNIIRLFPGTVPKTDQVEIPFARQTIPALLKHQIYLRDKDKCQFKKKDGSICMGSHFTEIHHEIPISEGGTNELINLKTLCSAHHKLMHFKVSNA